MKSFTACVTRELIHFSLFSFKNGKASLFLTSRIGYLNKIRKSLFARTFRIVISQTHAGLEILQRFKLRYFDMKKPFCETIECVFLYATLKRKQDAALAASYNIIYYK